MDKREKQKRWAESRTAEREAEREAYARDYPKITRELVTKRVDEAKQVGRTLVSFVVFVGNRGPKPRANNAQRALPLPLTGKPPRSNADSRCKQLTRHTYRCWWLVSDLQGWLRATEKNRTSTIPVKRAGRPPQTKLKEENAAS